MPEEDLEEQEARRKRWTVYLVAGGVLSLLVPLLVVLYIRLSESPAAGPAAARPGFVPRENWGAKVKPAVTPAPTAKSQAAPAGDSLGFVKGGSEYYPPAPARPAPEPVKAAAAPPALTPKPEVKKTAATGYKPFTQPKLKLTNSKNPVGKPPAGAPPDINALLKNIPGAGSGGAPGMPDMNTLMQQQQGK